MAGQSPNFDSASCKQIGTERIHTMQIWLRNPDNTKSYEISYSPENATLYSKYLPIIKRMISSFEFLS